MKAINTNPEGNIQIQENTDDNIREALENNTLDEKWNQAAPKEKLTMLKDFMRTILDNGSDINWGHVSKYFKEILTTPITHIGENNDQLDKKKLLLKTGTKTLIKENWALLKTQITQEEIQEMNSWEKSTKTSE